MSTRFHLDPDLIRQRVHLSSARAGRDHEKIHNRRDPGQIEYNSILTSVLFTKLGNLAGVFQATLQSVLRSGGGNGGGNGEAPRTNQNT